MELTTQVDANTARLTRVDGADAYGERIARILSGGDAETATKALETLEQLLLAWGQEKVTIERFDGDTGVDPGWFVAIDRFKCAAYGETLPDAFRVLGTGGHNGQGFFYTQF